MLAAEMAPDGDPQASTRAPAGLLLQLQGDLLEHDDIVLAHGARLFMAEDAVWTCPGFVDTWVNLPPLPVRAVARTLAD
jgi:hypothetical protein